MILKNFPRPRNITLNPPHHTCPLRNKRTRSINIRVNTRNTILQRLNPRLETTHTTFEMSKVHVRRNELGHFDSEGFENCTGNGDTTARFFPERVVVPNCGSDDGDEGCACALECITDFFVVAADSF